MNHEDFIRVDHLITDSGIGGAEKIMADLITHLDPNQFQCRLITLKKYGATAERIIEAGVPVRSLDLPADPGGFYFTRLPSALHRLTKQLCDDPPAILHCWLFQANLLGRLAARLAHVPVNISGLRVIEQERMIQYPLDRFTRSLVTRYVAVSENVGRHYEDRLGLATGSIAVVPNGIDPAPWEYNDGDPLRLELGLPAGTPVIGAAGRLHRQKGLDLLLAALPQPAALYPGLTLLIAGDGPERGKLERQAADLHLNVRFLGQWTRMSEFMAALDLFVLPSRWEGMPNVVLEAMAAGKAVIAAAVGGAPELVKSEDADETGVLVPPEDSRALAEAVNTLLEDPARRSAMGERARERVRRSFSLEAMVENYRRLYQTLLPPRETT